jgi:hypothetical protein
MKVHDNQVSGNADMTCPKCRAKIGTVRQLLDTVFGPTTGLRCFICGYWIQEFAGTTHQEAR